MINAVLYNVENDWRILMNQIINIDLKKHIEQSQDDTNKINKVTSAQKLSKRRVHIQFFLSITAIFIISAIFFYYKFSLNSKEDFSNLLINNYSITRLYANHNTEETLSDEENLAPDSIIGIIEIPSLNISYPIFNELTDELLKTSPCRFYGDFPSETNSSESSNLCIAGHNYDNHKFFSDIKDLNIDDTIILYDNANHPFTYSVIKKYEVEPEDLSPVYETLTNSYELTLVTCNNYNGNRMIIKAKIEDV